MRKRAILLALGIVFLALFLLSCLPRPCPFEFGVRAPPVARPLERDPIFKESCYDYVNFTADNMCCGLLQYREDEVLQCVRGLSAEQISRPRWPGSPMRNSTWDSGMVHVALVGDSHMRNLFVAVAERVTGKQLDYRIKAEKDVWQNAVRILRTMRLKQLKHTTEVRHLGVPFRVTWYQDWTLSAFPKLIDRWEADAELRPSVVVTGGGLHWMKNNPHPQGTPYKKFLDSLAPHLTRLSSRVPVFFKLIDYVPRSYTEIKKYPNFNPKAITLYNSIAREALGDTGIVIWDSTLQLSTAYTQECVRVRRVTPGNYEWNCADHGHIGYIMLEQYADMIYNACCNRFLNLGGKYCSSYL